MGWALTATITRATSALFAKKGVRFESKIKARTYHDDKKFIMVTYDSGADGNYVSKDDRLKAGMPILQKSTKQVGVANAGTCQVKWETEFPLPQLSKRAANADSFGGFPTSLMSVGKTNDDRNVSIFTKDGVTIHKEEGVLITYKGAPILIGIRDERGRYQIPLIQRWGQWRSRKLSKAARTKLEQANSVYDLPSTEQTVKWMHALCGYPAKSTWIKAIKVGNFMGWPMLTETNIKKYYLETSETSKGHLNQTRKNVRSTKTPTTNNGCHKPVLAKTRGTRGTNVSTAPGALKNPTRRN